MAETEQQKATGRPGDALRIYESLPEGERSYETVASRMGGITVPRAAEYVRRAAKIEGKQAILPRSSGGGGRKPKQISPAEQQLEELITSLNEQVQGFEERLNEARANLARFEGDGDAAFEAEVKRLDEAAKAARTRATEFAKADKATREEWAKAEKERLEARVTQVENDSNEQVEKARSEKERLESALAFLTESTAS